MRSLGLDTKCDIFCVVPYQMQSKLLGCYKCASYHDVMAKGKKIERLFYVIIFVHCDRVRGKNI